MTEVSKTAVSLRFFGDELDPEEITELMGHAPDACHKKGESITNFHTGNSHLAKQGHWRIEVDRTKPGDLDNQIQEILSKVTNDLAVWNKLTKKFQADIFTGIFLESENEGISLAPETLKLLSDRNLLIDLDIYFKGNTE